MTGTTLLCLSLGEVAPQLEPLRAEFHPGALARNLPLHMTLLYPFVPWPACDRSVHARVRRVCSGFGTLSFSLDRISTFPGGFVCADPEPGAPIRSLMRALLGRVPRDASVRGRGGRPSSARDCRLVSGRARRSRAPRGSAGPRRPAPADPVRSRRGLAPRGGRLRAMAGARADPASPRSVAERSRSVGRVDPVGTVSLRKV